MTMIKVDIDDNSGFCFGVRKAIEEATEMLKGGEKVYCVGDIVHNEEETLRLYKLGMSVMSIDDLGNIKDGTILFRAHGEPPSSYQKIKAEGLKLKDATCPVVLKLQKDIKKAYLNQKAVGGQIVIYGKRGHAEVIALVGQTNGEAMVVEDETEIELVDTSMPVEIFAQTTKDPEILRRIVRLLNERTDKPVKWHDTTCKQVTGRVPSVKQFASKYPVVVFVGGKKSSNAKILFQACTDVNSSSYFVSSPDEVKKEWFLPGTKRVGVCGATSTPAWLMEEVAGVIRSF